MPARSSKLPCPLCGATYWGQHNLAIHMAKRHHPCPHCDKSFIRLQMHVAKMHPSAILDGPES